jgi:hypothetical protein
MTQPTLMQIAADIRLWADIVAASALSGRGEQRMVARMHQWAEGIEYQTKMITEELTALLKEPPK